MEHPVQLSSSTNSYLTYHPVNESITSLFILTVLVCLRDASTTDANKAQEVPGISYKIGMKTWHLTLSKKKYAKVVKVGEEHNDALQECIYMSLITYLPPDLQTSRCKL